MKQPDAENYLMDVLVYGTSAIQILNHSPFQVYLQSRAIRAGVERELTIVGESLSKLRKMRPDLVEKITDATKIIAVRNRLSHDYGEIDDQLIWIAVNKHLPILMEEVRLLLKQMGRDFDPLHKP